MTLERARIATEFRSSGAKKGYRTETVSYLKNSGTLVISKQKYARADDLYPISVRDGPEFFCGQARSVFEEQQDLIESCTSMNGF